MKKPIYLLILGILAIAGGIFISEYWASQSYVTFFCGAATMWGFFAIREYDNIKKQHPIPKEP